MRAGIAICFVGLIALAAANNMRVFWGDRIQDKISRAALDGSGITTAVPEGVGAIHNLVAVPGAKVDNPPQLYWTDTDAGAIKSARGDARGRVSVVLDSLLEPKSLALFIAEDGTEWLYYGEATTNGVIGRVKTDGTGQETMVTPRAGYFPQAFDIDLVDGRLIYAYMKTTQDGGVAYVDFNVDTGATQATENVLFEDLDVPTDMNAREVYNPREIIASNETNTFFMKDRLDVYKVVGSTKSVWLSDRSSAWFDAEGHNGMLYWTEGLNDKTLYSTPDLESGIVTDLVEVLPTGLGSSPAGIAFAAYAAGGIMTSSMALLVSAAVAAIAAGLADSAW